MRLSDFLQGPASRHVQYYPNLVPILGSVTATILFGQLLYWRGKEKDPDGWLYKTQSEISEETALTREEQESARKKLREAGVLKEQKRGIPCRLWFWLDLDRVNDLWEKNQQNPQYEGKPQTRMRDSRKQDCGNAASKDEGKPQATTLDYPTDHPKNSSSKGDIPAAAFSPSAPQPLPPEVEAALSSLPPECRDVVSAFQYLPQKVITSNLELLRSRLSGPTPITNPAGWLRKALDSAYSGETGQRT